MGVVVVAIALLLSLLPTRSAHACSCAVMTLDAVAERDPGAAVARVRRIDDGGSDGVGEVLEVLRGTGLPDQVPLALDTGASCLPWVAVGDVAVLAFERSGGGWRTMTCGMLDPATGLDQVAVDAEAAGPAALVLSGTFPGADLVALDDHLRVLAAGSAPGYAHRLLPCEDQVLALGSDDEGRVLVTRLGLPDLVPTGQYVAAGLDAEHLDARCVEGRVDVLLRLHGPRTRVELHRDVLGERTTMALPDSASGTFAGDVVALVQPAEARDGPMTVLTLDPDTGDLRRVLRHPAGGWELTAAPDGRHVLVRGFAEGPMLLSVDLEAGRVVGESHGWWQPVQHPWVADDLVLQLDEDSGGVGAARPPVHRIVDLTLDPQRELSVPGLRPLAAFPGAVVLGSADRVTVTDTTLAPVRHLEAAWVAGAEGAVVLGPVAPDARAADTTLVDLGPAAADPLPLDARADAPSSRPATWVVAVALAAAVVALAVARVRSGGRGGA